MEGWLLFWLEAEPQTAAVAAAAAELRSAGPPAGPPAPWSEAEHTSHTSAAGKLFLHSKDV